MPRPRRRCAKDSIAPREVLRYRTDISPNTYCALKVELQLLAREDGRTLATYIERDHGRPVQINIA